MSVSIRIRQAKLEDSAAIAHVHVETRRVAYGSILSHDNLADFTYADSEQMWGKAFNTNEPVTTMLVAETQGGEIIGFALGTPERTGSQVYLGEVFAVYVLQEFQRTGVGRRLFLAVARCFLELGICLMLLWVFRDNHSARRFYESMGGEYLEQKAVNIGGTDREMVSYGWRNVANLVAGEGKFGPEH